MGNPTKMFNASEINVLLKNLINKKDDIEAEMEGHKGTLIAEKSTMNSPLVTLDGFPRDDIDVLVVRQARVRLIELRNDHAAIMSEIEKALHLALPPSSSSPQATALRSTKSSKSVDQDPSEPFAVVRSIDQRGPAGLAGIEADDLIVRFGSVLKENHDGLKALASLVGSNGNKPIEVVVLRGENKVQKRLSLTPKSGWGGRGMLGMHVVPI